MKIYKKYQISQLSPQVSNLKNQIDMSPSNSMSDPFRDLFLKPAEFRTQIAIKSNLTLNVWA